MVPTSTPAAGLAECVCQRSRSVRGAMPAAVAIPAAARKRGACSGTSGGWIEVLHFAQLHAHGGEAVQCIGRVVDVTSCSADASCVPAAWLNGRPEAGAGAGCLRCAVAAPLAQLGRSLLHVCANVC